MARTQFPTRSRLERPDNLDELEELGDDAIIAQQTAAHALQPRAIIFEESRSVVISEPSRPHSATFLRAAAEPTLVIRDRRALDEMRAGVELRRARFVQRRSLLVWGALGLVAFLLGGLVSFLAADKEADPSMPSSVRAQLDLAGGSLRAAAAESAVAGPVGKPVRLDELPVEARSQR